MRTIHKFLVPFASQAADELPPMPAHPASPVRLVAIDPRSGQPAVWIELDTDDKVPETGRRMAAFGTGHEIPRGWTHVGSMIDGGYVWHVHESPKA